MKSAERNTINLITEFIIASGFDRDSAQWVIDTLETRHGYELGALLGIETDSGRLKPLALSRQGLDECFVQCDIQYVEQCGPRPGQGVTGWVALAGRTALCPDVARDTRYFKLRAGIRSELCVPIWIGRRVVGVFNTETTRKDAYLRPDAKLLERVASVIGMAQETLSNQSSLL